MDEDDLYDEFGNLIGGSDISDDESSHSNLFDSEDESDLEQSQSHREPVPVAPPVDSTSLIKRQDQTLDNVTQIVVEPSDETDEVPVIQRSIEKKIRYDYTYSESPHDEDFKALPEIIYSRTFMIDTMKRLPERIRTIAIIGNFHSGKTSLLDALVLQTHSPSITIKKTLKSFKPLRFLDNHKIEIDRGISIKSSPITLILPDLKDKSFIFNFIDCPGHPNFLDESLASFNAIDGVLIILDVVEGLSSRDKDLITHVLQYNLPITLMINKIDRLILELKLPPQDAYYKIQLIIDEFNGFINNNPFISTYTHTQNFNPINNNIIFASATYEFTFTLLSFAKLYLDKNPNSLVNIEEFSQRLWGDYYFNPNINTFTTDSQNGKLSRTFISFILEPIYKLFTYTLVSGSGDNKLAHVLWNNFGITLPKDVYKQDVQILLKDVFKSILSGNKGLTSSLINSIPIPNLINSSTSTSISPFEGRIIKLIETSDAKSFYTLLKVNSGTIKVGTRIKIIGENFQEDEEDYSIEEIEEIYLPGGRYRVPIQEASKGFLVLIKGIDNNIIKGGNYVYEEDSNIELIPKYKSWGNKSIFKVAIEPASPSNLPKLLEGLRKLNKSYLDCIINVEESGEHIILSPGELYMDCMLHDLRNFFTDNLEIKVSDPMTKFGETCIEISSTKITTKTSSGHNQISIIAEPLNDLKLSKSIEMDKINLRQPIKTISKILRNDFGWDSLAARSLWYFGPNDLQSPSILLDDSLEEETNKDLLNSVKDSIRLGFKWGISEGPLCDEPIRNVKFKILDAVINGSEIQRSSTQIIPMTRRACYTGFLTATPRLLEPYYKVDIICGELSIKVVNKILDNRRGYLINQVAIAATNLFELEGVIPVIESIGFETDLRIQTQGQAMGYLSFKQWDIVPGDPLDSQAFLPSLKPVPNKSLARDFVMKTRKRKGLSGDPSLQKFIEPELYSKLKDKGFIN
ncbi:ATP dependent RNA helicase and U5 mRNA splicing factor [Scheffersomyces amazonensis]|uniref:ATP dependent RNA helicase and U5 mRNA splicing factor n=1 Tax=Scheffersomyces amazonensis TaxID=1078765 RepID=UPI00315CC4D8